jgi:hypothetical protein
VVLQVEALEDRNLLSTAGVLGPLVQVANVDPFTGNTADNLAGQAGTNFAGTQVEPSLAVDPKDPTHLVAAWQQDRWSNGGARGLVSAESTDGGNTWINVAPIPGISLTSGGTYQRASDPWVSIAPGGKYVYATSLSINLSGPFPSQTAILVSTSTDGGATWGSPTTLITNTSPFPGDLRNDKEAVTADPTDPLKAYVVWDRIEKPNDVSGKDKLNSFAYRENIFFSKTIDGGLTWSPAAQLTNFSANVTAIGNQILVEPDGTLVDAFTLQTGSGSQAPQADQSNLAVIRSPDHGATWSSPIIGPAIEAILVTVPNTGATVRTGDTLAEEAVDPSSGNLYAVWHDTRFSKGAFDSVAFSMSTNGGLTWSDPIKINQTPGNIPAGNQQAFSAKIAVNASGTLAVSYYDFRNPDGVTTGLPTDNWMVFASSKFTNPASWGGEERLTTSSFNMELAPSAGGFFVGDYQGLVAGGNDANSYSALFGQGLAPTSPLTRASGIFFRDPSPAESGSALGSAAVPLSPSAAVGPTESGGLVPRTPAFDNPTGLYDLGTGALQPRGWLVTDGHPATLDAGSLDRVFISNGWDEADHGLSLTGPARKPVQLTDAWMADDVLGDMSVGTVLADFADSGVAG